MGAPPLRGLRVTGAGLLLSVQWSFVRASAATTIATAVDEASVCKSELKSLSERQLRHM